MKPPPQELGSSDDLSQLSTTVPASDLSTCSTASSSASASDVKLARVVQQLQGLKLQLETSNKPAVMDDKKVSAAVECMQQQLILQQVPRPLVAKKGTPPGHAPAHTVLPAFAAWTNLNF